MGRLSQSWRMAGFGRIRVGFGVFILLLVKVWSTEADQTDTSSSKARRYCEVLWVLAISRVKRRLRKLRSNNKKKTTASNGGT